MQLQLKFALKTFYRKLITVNGITKKKKQQRMIIFNGRNVF